MASLFVNPLNSFGWKAIKTFHLRNQYNEVLRRVEINYFGTQYPTDRPPFLNPNSALTLNKLVCECGDAVISRQFAREKTELESAESLAQLHEKAADQTRQELVEVWQLIEFKRSELGLPDYPELTEFRTALFTSTDIDEKMKLFESKMKTTEKSQLSGELAILTAKAGTFLLAQSHIEHSRWAFQTQKLAYENALVKAKIDRANAETALKKTEGLFKATPNIRTETDFKTAKALFLAASEHLDTLTKGHIATDDDCHDLEVSEFCLPLFQYKRLFSLPIDRLSKATDKDGKSITRDFFDFSTNGLTVGAVLWLYYYERMGIFKILGALMDDYNYGGKLTLSGNRADKNGTPNLYSDMLDMVCTLHRLGMSPNLRDRIYTYERVLGVSIDNNLNIKCERNEGFMQSFNKLIDSMLEYYKAKQLGGVINNTGPFRSSVATQTTIRDTMNVLKNQFEPFQYGRNQINTFLGIATVHITLCLLNNVRREIGIPDQYERPEEFIPAAYDILVNGRAATLTETNRFIVHDNCATYGYRLLTDIETADLSQFTTVALGGTLDLWLDDVEGWVEGYRNAYSALPERATAMVTASLN